MAESNANQPVDKPKPEKKKRLRGFPGMLWGQLSLLNESEVFKRDWANENFDVLLVATDEKYAAYFKVGDGKAEMEQIDNKKEELKKIKPKGKLECTFEDFMGIATGKIKKKQMVWMLITRRIKLKGMDYFKKFAALFKIVVKMQKEKLKPKTETPEKTE